MTAPLIIPAQSPWVDTGTGQPTPQFYKYIASLSSGGGSIKGIYAGTGIVTSPATITSQGTVSLASQPATTLLGNYTTASGPALPVTVGSGLSLSTSGTLTAADFGTFPVGTVLGNVTANQAIPSPVALGNGVSYVTSSAGFVFNTSSPSKKYPQFFTANPLYGPNYAGFQPDQSGNEPDSIGFTTCIPAIPTAQGGKIYVELQVIDGTVLGLPASAALGGAFGMCNNNFPLYIGSPGVGLDVGLDLGGTSIGVQFNSGGGCFYKNSLVSTQPGNGYIAGSVWSLAVDFTNQKMWFRNSVAGNPASPWQGALAGPVDPSNNVNGIDISNFLTNSGGLVYFVSEYATNHLGGGRSVFQMRGGPGLYMYPAPAGYSTFGLSGIIGLAPIPPATFLGNTDTANAIPSPIPIGGNLVLDSNGTLKAFGITQLTAGPGLEISSPTITFHGTLSIAQQGSNTILGNSTSGTTYPSQQAIGPGLTMGPYGTASIPTLQTIISSYGNGLNTFGSTLGTAPTWFEQLSAWVANVQTVNAVGKTWQGYIAIPPWTSNNPSGNINGVHWLTQEFTLRATLAPDTTNGVRMGFFSSQTQRNNPPTPNKIQNNVMYFGHNHTGTIGLYYSSETLSVLSGVTTTLSSTLDIAMGPVITGWGTPSDPSILEMQVSYFNPPIPYAQPTWYMTAKVGNLGFPTQISTEFNTPGTTALLNYGVLMQYGPTSLGSYGTVDLPGTGFEPYYLAGMVSPVPI